MAILNPYDLLEDVDTDDTSKLLEKIAKKKAEEAAAAAREAAKKIAELRDAAEKEDKERVAEGSYFQAPIVVKETSKRTIVRSAGGDAGRAQGNRGNGYGRNSGYNGNVNGFPGDYDSSKGEEIDTNTKGSGSKNAGRRSGGYGNGNFGGYEQRRREDFDAQIGNDNGSRDNERPRKIQSEKRKDKADAGNADEKPNAGNVVTEEPVDTANAEGTTINSEKEVKKDESLENDANKDKEEEEKLMTLNDYEKIFEEKRKRLLAMKKTEERKVDLNKEFETMQQLSLKKGNDEIFVKLASEKEKKVVQGTKQGSEKDDGEKAKKTVTVSDIFTFKRERPNQYPRPRRQDGFEGQRSSPAAPSSENQGRARGNSQESDGYSGGQRSSFGARSNDNQGNGYGGQRNSSTGPSTNNQGRDRDERTQFKGVRRAQPISRTPSLENPSDFPPLKTA